MLHNDNALHSLGFCPTEESKRRIRTLFESGADVNKINWNGKYHNTPLHVLIVNERFIEARFFIAEARRLHLKIDFNMTDSQKKNLLILASKVRNEAMALDILEAAGDAINLDACDEDGMTALHYACALGMPTLALSLLKRGASMTLENHKKRQPLDCIEMSGENTRAILNAVEINPDRDEFALQNSIVDKNIQPILIIVPGYGVVPLENFIAIKANKTRFETMVLPKTLVDSNLLNNLNGLERDDLFKMLVDNALKADEKMQLVHQFDVMSGVSVIEAVYRDRTKVRDIMLAEGAPYDWLVRYYAANGDSKKLEPLLHLPSTREQINKPGLPSGRTALHHAAAKRHSAVCLVLANAGANLDSQDADGHTPLMLACLAKENKELIICLVDLGADVSVKNKRGKTIFQLLADSNQSHLIDEVASRSRKRIDSNIDAVTSSINKLCL